MTLRIIRFVECQLDDNWRFRGKRGKFILTSWIRSRDKIIIANTEGAKMGISVSDNHGITLKFKKGALVEINNGFLAYDIADTL